MQGGGAACGCGKRLLPTEAENMRCLTPQERKAGLGGGALLGLSASDLPHLSPQVVSPSASRYTCSSQHEAQPPTGPPVSESPLRTVSSAAPQRPWSELLCVLHTVGGVAVLST